MQVSSVDRVTDPVQVRRWPSEMPLFVTIVIISLILWTSIIVGTLGIGLIYFILIAVFLFFAHAAFIAHIRGSAIRLGPDQFPELHARVVEFAARSGLKSTPAAYLMQADGALNAFATKLFRGEFVVLYADLLDACGDDRAARDMIIGHEIGHLRSNHLNWNLVTLPGRFIPFLGSAYSRACEFTCDRWGSALSGDPVGARRGLLVLAAGAGHYGKVNEAAFIRQQEDLDTGWMTLARWLGTYPPLSARVQAIGADFGSTHRARKGALRAWAIILLFIAVPVGILLAVPSYLFSFTDIGRQFESELGAIGGAASPSAGVDPSAATVETFASIDDMPPPTDVPALDDQNFLPAAEGCFAGNLQSCDFLYMATPVGTPEEQYGLTCGGRLPDNSDSCVERVPSSAGTTAAAPPTYASVEEMPAPAEIPQLADENFRAGAESCFAGDLAACDELYRSTPVGSPEERYGRSCGGRLVTNSSDCAELLATDP